MFERASRVLPYGSARTYGAHHPPYQLYVKRGVGSRLWDIDDNEYVDYNCAGGVLILGHAHPAIIKAVNSQIKQSSTLIPSNEQEVLWAEKIVKHVPCAEMVMAAASGSEACEYAIRLAKLYSNKKKLVKFEGSYHGHQIGNHDFSRYPPADVRGPYERPNPVPESVDLNYLPCVQENTIVVPYNNAATLEAVLEKERQDIAAVIIEPVLRANIPAKKEFMKKVRSLTQKHGVLLIFDEVVSGFRMGLGGGQEYYDITADIVTLGKALGGGLAVGAVASSTEIMSLLMPGRPDGRFLKHQGTHSGNPLTTAASLATIKELEKKGVYEKMNRHCEELKKVFCDAAEDNKVEGVATGATSMWGVYFSEKEVIDFRSAIGSDFKKLLNFQMQLVVRGICPIVGSTRNSLTIMHTEKDLALAKEAFYDSMKALRHDS